MKTMTVLFLCTGNSCRSIRGEATLKHLAPEGWHTLSAGSHPLRARQAEDLA